MKKDLTEIIVILDRSASMSSIALEMREAFNHFIGEQKKLPGECLVTLAQFDDGYEMVYLGKPIEEVPLLELSPRGNTALLDAMGRTILATGHRLATTAEHDRPERVLMVVISDGQENSSRKFTREQVLEMVKHQTEKYSWQFVYFGANQDAIREASRLGINVAQNFVANRQGVHHAMRGLSAGTSSYRSGQGYR